MSNIHNHKKLKIYRRQLRRDQTDAEKTLWHYLRAGQLGYRFRRQHSIGPYILDFYCPAKRLAIELDGGQHNDPKDQHKDTLRTQELNKLNIKVLRYWNNQALVNTDDVLEDIVRELEG